MGRSRGGLTTKIHALVDAEGLPITLKLTEGQAHDGKSAEGMLDDLAAGQILLADRGYDSDAARNAIAARGAWANIKPIGAPNLLCQSPRANSARTQAQIEFFFQRSLTDTGDSLPVVPRERRQADTWTNSSTIF